MYKFPIRLPEGRHLDLAQAFRAPAPVDISHALSVQTTDHLGVDVTAGTAQQTWGLECVWPFPWPGIVYDAVVDSPLGAKLHAHSQIDTTDPATGIKYSLIYLHLSAVTKTKQDTDTLTITYNQGDVIGRIGNNGGVSPAPTPSQPLAGTHLHLGVGQKNPSDLNYLMVDPLLFFNLADPFYVPGTSYKFNNNLSFQQTSPEVGELQQVLKKEECFPATQSITNYYGPITAKAVLAFRVKYNIPTVTDINGYSCGPLTRAALNKL